RGGQPPTAVLGASTGSQIRLALQQMQRGELPAAIAIVNSVLQKFPDNDTLLLLRREIEERRSAGPVVFRPQPTASDLRAIIAAFNDNRLTPDQRSQLDRMTFTSTAVFDQGPPFETGRIDDVPFRFSQPMTFSGNFASKIPLRLTYRILGATQQNGADALLLEPLRLEVPR
ncbi:MAG TPA: hypothetical protein VGA33_12340, partial [Thermoanaerobaculia bacterium]